MAAATMGWQSMGKPDFSQCAKLFYRLPAGLREGLNRSEEKVLIWTLFLTWWQNFHSGRGTVLASFSETWIGVKFGRSRWTAARALVKLEGLSLIKRIRRGPKKDGTFRTNLVALSGPIWAVLGIHSRQGRDKSPCSKSAPQEVGNVYKREKAAPFSESPLLSKQGEDTEWNEDDAGNAEKQKKWFMDILWNKKPSVAPA